MDPVQYPAARLLEKCKKPHKTGSSQNAAAFKAKHLGRATTSCARYHNVHQQNSQASKTTADLSVTNLSAAVLRTHMEEPDFPAIRKQKKEQLQASEKDTSGKFSQEIR